MDTTVKEHLAPYDPAVRELALKARGVVLAVMPGAIEQIGPAAKIVAYGFGRRYADLVCAIAPQRTYVNLMFARGATLPDPEGLLEGTGKRARDVKLRTPDQVDAAGVRELLAAALAAMDR